VGERRRRQDGGGGGDGRQGPGLAHGFAPSISFRWPEGQPWLWRSPMNSQ
jgi:hypothetical protein